MRLIAGVFCIGLILLIQPLFVRGQQFSTGIARYADVEGGKAQEGDVITTSARGFALANNPYDSKVQGVIVDNPAIYFRSTTDQGKKFQYINEGDVYVRVSTANGPIARGDVLSTSNMPGIAMKATKSGYIIGTAQDDYSSSSPTKIGKIRMSFGVRYVASRVGLGTSLFDIFNLSALATYEQPLTVFKYVLAGIVAIISLSFGFLYFGRIAAMGIEALGRNPLASRMIQLGIFLNVVLTAMIIGGGIFISVLILRL
ncbi:hypothetical protein HYS00_04900 [Candidatus Microgenomates bacterium]|nr:hypothetical protein [Candidatus Microgenomates bacterium]